MPLSAQAQNDPNITNTYLEMPVRPGMTQKFQKGFRNGTQWLQKVGSSLKWPEQAGQLA